MNATTTLHRPLVPLAHRARLLDIHESRAPPTREMVAADWLPVMSL